MKNKILAAALILVAPAAGHAELEASWSSANSAFRQLQVTPLRPIISAARLNTTEDDLLELLDSSDAAARAQAARSLSQYATNSRRTQEKLLEVVGRYREELNVRREAVKSLAWATQHANVKARLLELAADRDAALDLRAIALKALYPVAAQNDVSSALRAQVKDSYAPLALRKAAAWTLWVDGADYQTRRVLIEATEDGMPLELRVEAAKSLFGQMNDYAVKNQMDRLARDTKLPDTLREAAVWCFLLINHDNSVKTFLTDLARNDPSQKARLTAIRALNQGISLEAALYFHLSYFRQRFLDPLENE